MDQRFPNEFVTWNHKTPIGVKVDEVFGMDNKKGQTWISLAKQIFSEQGDTDYRIIEHFESGAPFMEGYSGRISLTHTKNLLAVAFLPKTPEVSLEVFNPRTALGIDAEPLERTQVIKVRDKFLNEKEKSLVPEEDIIANILAWTSKEALYKAALTAGLDFKKDIELLSLSALHKDPLNKTDLRLGDAKIHFPANSGIPVQEMKLYSYESYGCCISIAYSPKCAKFGK